MTAGGSATMAPAGTYGDIKLQLSWIKNYEFGGEFFALENGYFTDAGFSSVELVTGPVPSADELVATGEVDDRPVGPGRHRPLHPRLRRRR